MTIIYDIIGLGYNSTRRADPYLTGRLLHFKQPAAGKRYLDIGCGTGNYTIALASGGLNLTGVEPSEKMLNEARRRHQQITWLQGSAEQIPVNDEAFDGIIATLTIHHWADLENAMKEICRVCKPGGTFVIFTATPGQMEGYWLNHYFPQMLRSSIIQMPAFNAVENALTNAGFTIRATEKYFIQNDLQDLFLYSGKHKPEIYFDEEIRKGISSFAALANADEVKHGLAKLRRDLKSGEFEAVRRSYENEEGDYLFVVAEKICQLFKS